jgi:hypothetical protein
MRIEFKETFRLPLEEVFSYFRSPHDWVRLYGFAGEVNEYGDGWFGVPLKRFPFPLVAKVTRLDPNRHVRWVFKGFWHGDGEVTIEREGDAVVVKGYEDISMPWVPGLSSFIEKRFLEREFQRIWQVGWRRLRKREQPAPETAQAQ